MPGQSATHSTENSRKRQLFKKDYDFSGWNGSSRGNTDYCSTYRIGHYLSDKYKERGGIYLLHDTEKCGIDSVKVT